MRAILRDRCQIKVVPVQASAAADQVSHDAIPEFGERERARERVGRRQAGSRAASHVQHAPQPAGLGGASEAVQLGGKGALFVDGKGALFLSLTAYNRMRLARLAYRHRPAACRPAAGRKKEYGRAPSRWQVSISTADASHGDVCEEYVRVCI